MNENWLAEAWNVKAGTILCMQGSACGKLQSPRFESELPNCIAVTRYVFNKLNPEDVLNIDIVKRIIWIWQLTVLKKDSGVWHLVFSDVRNSCILCTKKSFQSRSWLQPGCVSQSRINELQLNWSRKNCLDYYTNPCIVLVCAPDIFATLLRETSTCISYETQFLSDLPKNIKRLQ